MSELLKPCPFCKGEAIRHHNHEVARCENGCTGWLPFILWNTRNEYAEHNDVTIDFSAHDIVVQEWSSKPSGGFCLSPKRGVKITHIPTGLTATCESERSQHQNKHKAIEELAKMLAEHEASQK